MSRSFFKVEVEVRTERDIDEYEVPRYLCRQEEDFVKIDRIEAFYPRDFWRKVNRAAQKYDLYRIRIQDQAHWLIATVSGGAGQPTKRQWWIFEPIGTEEPQTPQELMDKLIAEGKPPVRW